MKKYTRIIAITGGIFLFGAGCGNNNQNTNINTNINQNTPPAVEDQQTQKTNLIKVNNLPNGSKIHSPITITGMARGQWFFEASFPVTLRDANGKELVQTHAQAQGEWMTTEFVPWSTTLTFQAPTTTTGTIHFMKDNPSGLPEHDDQLVIPVEFILLAPSAATTSSANIATSSVAKLMPKPVIAPKVTKPAPKTVTVQMVDNAFSPQVIAVNEGDTIVWVNKGKMNHTSSGANGVLLWDSGSIAPDGSYRRTFNGEGRYEYRCANHPSMLGTVIVGRVIPSS